MKTRRNLPSLDLLTGFEAVARHLSFTKAGEELCVTQSAVSRQIRLLEAQLGVQLFERRTRAVVLTDAGHAYYGEIQPLLQQLQQVTRKVMARIATRHLRVTTTLTFASLWLVPRLAHFQERHPGIEVHVVADNALRDLTRDRFDVAIRYCTRAQAGARAGKLFDERLVPVCSPRLINGQRLDSVDALDAFPFIHFIDLEGRAPWLSWDRWLASMKRGGIGGSGAVYFSHYEQAIRAAQAGQGIALGRLPVIDSLLDEGKLVTPLHRRVGGVKPNDRAYFLLLPEGRADREESRVFVEWLRDEAAARKVTAGLGR